MYVCMYVCRYKCISVGKYESQRTLSALCISLYLPTYLPTDLPTYIHTQASVQIAIDMVNEGLISETEALLRIDAERMTYFLHPTIDPKTNKVRMYVCMYDGL